MKTKVTCLELTLPPRERRKRRRLMARLAVGSNAPTRRQIRRLPNRDTTSGCRKAERSMRRIMHKQGMTKADLQ